MAREAHQQHREAGSVAPKVVLVSALYRDPDDRRFGELLECVARNSRNPLLAEVHVFLEEPLQSFGAPTLVPALRLPKVKPVAFGRRVRYQDLFDYANTHLRGCTVVIANADIYFDQTLARLEGYGLAGCLLCLSRWNIEADGMARLFDHAASQDAWIFSAPIRPFECNFPLGVPGCDNRLAFEAERAGLAVSNPSRSLRALHLHASQVRRYDESDRLQGPTRAVALSSLGSPWTWFVVPCMGRLAELQQTLESLVAQPRASHVLIDYSCPQGSGAWVREHHPEVMVLSVENRSRFNGAAASNLGATLADQDALLCFLPAGVRAAPGLSLELLERHQQGAFLVPDAEGWEVLACRKVDFDRLGGCDEALLDWGGEVTDLRAALKRNGLLERRFPAALLARPQVPSPPGSERAITVSGEARQSVQRAYERIKSALLEETGIERLSVAAMREIHRAIAARELRRRFEAPQAACAAVTFRESMGYTLAPLRVGESTHNNERHTIISVPAALERLTFTQVVAHRVSPVDLEFLGAGKVYVLVGGGWYGYRDAVAWIQEVGYREPLPDLVTVDGSPFEVWSLLAEQGERFTSPTQVMLATTELIHG